MSKSDDQLDKIIQQMLVDYTGWVNGEPINWYGKKMEAKQAIRTRYISREKITYDSWPIGWEGDEHYRQLVLIQNGKVIAKDKRSDTFLRGHYSSGSITTEQHIIEWSEQLSRELGLGGTTDGKQ